MVILSYVFSPRVGGIEIASAALAGQFAEMGYQVTVVTSTAENDGKTYPYRLIRNPSPWRLIRAILWADVILINNWSIRLGWPLYYIRRPTIVTTQIWLSNIKTVENLKRLSMWPFFQTAVSRYLAAHVRLNAKVIPNACDPTIFHNAHGQRKPDSILFVGRLEKTKGVHILLQAAHLLKKTNCSFNLTIAGNGPEMDALLAAVSRYDLREEVSFTGTLTRQEIAKQMNRHEMVVVPSIWEEPFGMVAPEALSCGCKLVVTRRGGLVEACGGCGFACENGDADSLAEAIRACRVFRINDTWIERRDRHLASLSPLRVCRMYHDWFTALLDMKHCNI